MLCDFQWHADKIWSKVTSLWEATKVLSSWALTWWRVRIAVCLIQEEIVKGEIEKYPYWNSFWRRVTLVPCCLSDQIRVLSSTSTEPELDKVICRLSKIYLEWLPGLGSLLEPRSLGPPMPVDVSRGNSETGTRRPWTNLTDYEYLYWPKHESHFYASVSPRKTVRKTVLKVRCFKDALQRGSKGGFVHWWITKERFQEGIP